MSVFLGAPVHAETPERQLSISPLRTELVVEPGTTETGIITLYNTGKQRLDIQLSTQVFTVTDESYDYVFNENSTANQWIRYSPANFALEAGSSKTVEYQLTVPLTASAGDKYFGIFASTAPTKSDSPIATTERVASLIYLIVPGEITKTGKLLKLRSPLVTIDDTNWSATIQNSGSALFRSHYSVSIQTLWGEELSRDEDAALILSNSIRLVTSPLVMPDWLGVYKAVYSIELGDSTTITETRPIIYVPPLQIAIFLAIVSLVALWLFTGKPKTRKKS